MFTKIAKHRKFEYTPHYYNPDEERKSSDRPQINFRRMRSRQKTRPFIWMIILLGFVVYLLIALSRIAQNY